MISRRTAIAGIGSALLGAAAQAQEPLPPPSAKRSSPMLCVYSGNLAKVPYAMLGDIAGQIGFEGVDLTCFPGGHVNPYMANVDMVRAAETIRASNLELPMISTELTAITNPVAYAVLALASQGAIPMFRTGYWPLGLGSAEARVGQVRRDIAGLVAMGRRCAMATMIPNRAGDYVGHSVAQAQELIAGMEPRWTGFYFDVSACVSDAGADNWAPAFRSALPRVKAVAVSDFRPKKDNAAPDPCPLGQGIVDWGKAFGTLAEARFTGPISIHKDYAAKDNVGALRNDLEFVRKHVEQAYSAVQKS